MATYKLFGERCTCGYVSREREREIIVYEIIPVSPTNQWRFPYNNETAATFQLLHTFAPEILLVVLFIPLNQREFQPASPFLALGL